MKVAISDDSFYPLYSVVELTPETLARIEERQKALDAIDLEDDNARDAFDEQFADVPYYDDVVDLPAKVIEDYIRAHGEFMRAHEELCKALNVRG